MTDQENMVELATLQNKFLSESHPYSANIWVVAWLFTLNDIDSR